MNNNNKYNEEKIYKKLESSFIKYTDLINIPVIENNENFYSLSDIKAKNIKVEYIKKDMDKFFSGKIIVREKIYKKIINILKYLKEYYPNTGLRIVYGFRSLDIQNKYFQKNFKKFKKKYPQKTSEEIYNITHTQVAVPEVSGHPTGGAIDLTLFNIITNKDYKMGGKIADYSKEKQIYTFSPEISKKELKNRLFLKKIMEKENFAPFLGEWWHFSYGDKEWAKYYNKKNAIYSQKKIKDIIIKK